MPLLVYLNPEYLIPRFALWVLLLAASFTDGWRHRCGCGYKRTIGSLHQQQEAPSAAHSLYPWPAAATSPTATLPPLLSPHRSIRSRGYQLYFALVGVIGLYVIRECVLLAYSYETDGGEDTSGESAIFDIYIFFSNLADSVWFAILLSVAAGFW